MESQSKSTDLAVRGELETLRQQHEHLKVNNNNDNYSLFLKPFIRTPVFF